MNKSKIQTEKQPHSFQPVINTNRGISRLADEAPLKGQRRVVEKETISLPIVDRHHLNVSSN
jgi:hypothetical protein